MKGNYYQCLRIGFNFYLWVWIYRWQPGHKFQAERLPCPHCCRTSGKTYDPPACTMYTQSLPELSPASGGVPVGSHLMNISVSIGRIPRDDRLKEFCSWHSVWYRRRCKMMTCWSWRHRLCIWWNETLVVVWNKETRVQQNRSHPQFEFDLGNDLQGWQFQRLENVHLEKI